MTCGGGTRALEPVLCGTHDTYIQMHVHILPSAAYLLYVGKYVRERLRDHSRVLGYACTPGRKGRRVNHIHSGSEGGRSAAGEYLSWCGSCPTPFVRMQISWLSNRQVRSISVHMVWRHMSNTQVGSRYVVWADGVSSSVHEVYIYI